jgi:hypothetical protein
VDAREVVAILDIRRLQRTPEARALLARASQTTPQHDGPRTVVVTTRGLHAVPASTATVARRIKKVSRPARDETAER